MIQKFLIFSLFLVTTITYTYSQSDNLPRGAYLMPYTRYEAEDGIKGGNAILHSDTNFDLGKIGSEASNQKYVSLSLNGDYISWSVSKPGNGVTLRFTMPDAPTGNGLKGSLNVYVNGIKDQTILLTSYWAYQYFPSPDPVQTPSGKTFMRFDEVHFKLNTALKSGDNVRIQKDNGDALTYGIDFIEVEDVPPPLEKPSNFLSITDFGAISNDTIDDLPALNNCISQAISQNKGVYIPSGKFYLNNKLILNAQNIKIQGAGIWHTQLYFSNDTKFSGGILARASNVEISHFYMNTINKDRMVNGDYRIYKAFMGTYGNNSYIHDIWEEHFECGFWLGGYDPPYPVDITTNLKISNCRIRNNYADGINFCEGTSNCIAEHCSFRNNGDDAMAIWPDNSFVTQPCANNVFRYNTVENNWRAGSCAIFGGYGHEVHHCLIKDGVAGSGIRFTNDFPGFGFDNTKPPIRIYEITIINCGTSYDLWDQKRGAIEIYANKSISNIIFENINIINAQRDGVQIYGQNINNIFFNNLTIEGTGKDTVTRNIAADIYGGFGIYAEAGSDSIVFNNLTVKDAESGVSLNRNTNFKLIIKNQTIPLKGITISPSRVYIAQGDSTSVNISFNPTDATNKTISWNSSDENIAKATSLGTYSAKILAQKQGSCIITATSQDGNFSAMCTVFVNPYVNLSASKTSISEKNDTVNITFSASSLTKDIVVKYKVGGTATKEKYSANPMLNDSIVLTPNKISASISINSIDNNIFDGPKTIIITLLEGNEYIIGEKSSVTITITDNDLPPCNEPSIIFTPVPPLVDGYVDSIWQKAPQSNISNTILGSKPEDFSAFWKALFDNQNLYLLIDVTDNIKTNNQSTNWWESDACEIFIDGDNSKLTTYDNVNDFQFGFRWNDTNIYTGNNSVKKTNNIVFKMLSTNNGYILEVAIPWMTIGVTPYLGKPIGFEIAIDNANGDSRIFQAAAFATSTTAWSNPSVFGTVYLTSCDAVYVNYKNVINNNNILRKTLTKKFFGNKLILPEEYSYGQKYLYIYNAQGKLIKQYVTKNKIIDFSKELNLGKKLYIVKIK
jgi:uncharacterized protein YjdB